MLSEEPQRRVLKVQYSQEAAQDIMAEYGVPRELQLIHDVAGQMNNAVNRQLMTDFDLVMVSGEVYATPGRVS
jgi:hypothetical protein